MFLYMVKNCISINTDWLCTLFVSSLAEIKETGKRFRHSFYFSNPENHKTCCLTPRWPQLSGNNGNIVIQHELGGCSVHEPLLGSTWYCITLFLLQSLKALRAPNSSVYCEAFEEEMSLWI